MQPHQSWQDSLSALRHPRVVSMLFLGFSAGIPLLLIFSSLSLWLREAGVERATVTYFSWAALAYSFKFLWAPLIDRLPIPLLTRTLGRRRAWMFISQVCIMLSIAAIGLINPQNASSLNLMALIVVALGFSSATQDIVIDAYRIESVSEDLQAMMSSTYIAGYRIGMLTSGAGALILASYFGSTSETYEYEAWRTTYLLMSQTLLVGLITTLSIREPDRSEKLETQYSSRQYLKFLSLFFLGILTFVVCYSFTGETVEQWKREIGEISGNAPLSNFLIESARLALGLAVAALVLKGISLTTLYEKQLVRESYIAPIADFFERYGQKFALLLLVFIGFYRISDIVLGVISNVFFQDIGFTKTEIATVVKTFGLFMTILGGFLGGFLAVRYGVIRTLYLGAVLTVATNLLFLLLAQWGHHLGMLYLVISADNLTAGLASAAFVAFLSSLTNVSFTAVQYAVFSSLMTLLPKVIGGYSGSMVDNLGYSGFFLVASAMGLPVILLINWIQRNARFKDL